VQVSPTYYILTAVAITDLLTMLSYLPYAVYFYCVATPEPEYQHRLVSTPPLLALGAYAPCPLRLRAATVSKVKLKNNYVWWVVVYHFNQLSYSNASANFDELW